MKDIEVLLTMVGGNVEFLWSSHTFPLTCEITTPGTTTTPWFTHFVISGLIVIALISQKKFRRKGT